MSQDNDPQIRLNGNTEVDVKRTALLIVPMARARLFYVIQKHHKVIAHVVMKNGKARLKYCDHFRFKSLTAGEYVAQSIELSSLQANTCSAKAEIEEQ